MYDRRGESEHQAVHVAFFLVVQTALAVLGQLDLDLQQLLQVVEHVELLEGGFVVLLDDVPLELDLLDFEFLLGDLGWEERSTLFL